MNDWDKNNYEYVMSLSEEDYDMFLETASEDDLNYLQELIDQKKVELQMNIMSSKINWLHWIHLWLWNC